MTAQIESINNGLLILMLGTEFILILMLAIAVIYNLILWIIEYKERKAISSKYTIYDKYKLQKPFKQPK